MPSSKALSGVLILFLVVLSNTSFAAGNFDGCNADRVRWESCFSRLGIVEGDAYRGLGEGKACAACINHFWSKNSPADGIVYDPDVKECVLHDHCEKAEALSQCLAGGSTTSDRINPRVVCVHAQMP